MRWAMRFALLMSSLVLAQASPIGKNPSTPLGTISILNHRNPAFGGPPAHDMMAPVVVDRPAQTIDVNGTNSTRHRQLEVSSPDVKKLEEYFGMQMETNIDTIYKKYASASPTKVPWPSSFWPTYLDSINFRWMNVDEASPAEKYATAFGLDIKNFTFAVSKYLGVASQLNRTRVCWDDKQCEQFNDGSACAKQRGSWTGFCVPMWYGLCHAWAPAAILEEEPQCDVTKNGTVFHPLDIKGLLAVAYDGAQLPIVFTGARYDGLGSDRDEFGRFTDATERDLGPGFFHIAVTNIMGRFGKSFIVDVDPAAPIWSQPVRGYSIDAAQIMTPSQAASTYFNVPTYPFNQAAVSIAYMHMTFRYINEYVQDGPLVSTGIVDQATVTKDYYYLLELDAKQNIIGGEWLYGSQTDHPDFLWFHTRKPNLDVVTLVGLSYKNVLSLLQQSLACK